MFILFTKEIGTSPWINVGFIFLCSALHAFECNMRITQGTYKEHSSLHYAQIEQAFIVMCERG